VKSKDEIRTRIVEVAHTRMILAMSLEGKASPELDELDSIIHALNWVLDFEPFNAENYGA
jgi:hypothetical protein